MRNSTKLLATAAVSAGVIMAAATAQAATIVPITNSPLSLPGNPSGVVPAGVIADGLASDNPYDFTFSTVGATYKTLMQLQGSNLNGKAQNIAFELFQGTPGTGTFVANSGGTATAATLLTLTKGTYYMEVDKINAPKGELITGGVTLLGAVPEPATWATMLIGLGALGASMRNRRRALAGAAAA